MDAWNRGNGHTHSARQQLRNSSLQSLGIAAPTKILSRGARGRRSSASASRSRSPTLEVLVSRAAMRLPANY